MMPEFHSEKQGYNKREVDEYIDQVRSEHDKEALYRQTMFSDALEQMQEQMQAQLQEMETTPEVVEKQTFILYNPGDWEVNWENEEDMDVLLTDFDRFLRNPFSGSLPASTPPSPPVETYYLIEPGLLNPADALPEAVGNGDSAEETQWEEYRPLGMANPQSPKQQRLRTYITGFCFYSALIAFVLGIYLFSGVGSNAPRTLFRFSVMTVLTESMQSEIPKDSFILTRKVDPKSITVGDDVTYMLNATTPVTHRVVGIYENYEATGERGFETKGIENEKPDGVIVPAASLVGKVIFHSFALGKTLKFIKTNIIYIAILFVLIAALLVALRIVFLSKEEQLGEPKQKFRQKFRNKNVQFKKQLTAKSTV